MACIIVRKPGPQCRSVLLGLALGVIMVLLPGSSNARAASFEVRFALPMDSDLDFFRIHVGSQSKSYSNRLEIRAPMLDGRGNAVSMQQQLAAVLTEPR